MKKNKTIAYLMAATLLVGGTFLGTKALFTDKVDTAGEISISTGDVDLEITSMKDWELDRNGYEPNTGTGQVADFDNLKYGDVLTKQVTVTNTGTLSAIASFDENEEVTGELPKGIEYDAEFKVQDGATQREDGKIDMPIGSSIVVDLKLEVTGGGKHNAEGSLNSNKQEETIIDLENSYVVNATQQNPKNK